MSDTKLIGNRLLTPSEYTELKAVHAKAYALREHLEQLAERACELLGIDPAGCSLAKDFAEEIVLQGTLPSEAIRNMQRHLEATR